MQQTYHPIGILGGTFDPIHLGHLRLALELHDALKLTKVHIVPCYQPVHRQAPIATPEQRLAMVELAVENEPSLCADDNEIQRQGPSYMIDTLLAFRQEMPQTPLCLLVGIDAFLGFSSWKRWQEILEHAHMVIAHRPHHQTPTKGDLADLIKNHLQSDAQYIHQHLAGGILLRPITALEISATDIRQQIATEQNIRYLLPNRVYDYIKQHHIYSECG